MKKAIITILAIFVMVNICTFADAQAESNDSARYIGPAPVQQLALPSQPGFITFDKKNFEEGDSVYAFSIFDEARVDGNNYIWADQFTFAKNAVVTGFREDGMVLIRLNGDDHDLFVIYECPQQSAVIYPRAQ